MKKEKLIGDHTLDTFHVEQQRYMEVSKSIAEVILNSVSDEQLQDIETQILVLAIHSQKLDGAPHKGAIFAQFLTTLRRRKAIQKKA